ncbi:hypothetical protein [Pseudorhodoferax sp. Leaf267]|uniref:hypothetical protein n=1 Tax=Pseudorhodoferax sp. Leaf267 TaxID=1736316 RepID=UPI0006F53834|nr:hypothetical protein [Pseudorhodoferax sp. Leaf267]KQP12280.1 hypothetical protein ASF43_22510 [Pseudorhodoferax sp. Leaf267]
MTGLLHRLAARATGTAWTVRTDARLPFGAAPAFEGDAMHEPAPAVWPGATARHAAPHTQADAGTGVAPWTTAPPGAAIAHTVLPDAPPGASPTRPAPDTTRPPQAPDTLAAPALQRPHALHATGVQARATPGTPAAPAAPTTGASAPHAGAAPPGRRPPAREDPAPLLPRMADAAPRPPGAPAAPLPAPAPRGPGAAMPTAPLDTEVHIHIGRIDVTALHEAPAPKPRPRERTQPVSLDAYLARRGDPR